MGRGGDEVVEAIAVEVDDGRSPETDGRPRRQ
jgi:hypothetical protein